MLKIYISLWDPLLFLLPHKDKFIIIFLLFLNFNSFGEPFFSEGTHFFPKNISEEQCFENAKKDAIKNIMNKAGYSYLTNRENLICAEVKGNDICEYFEEVQISYDNGFLKSKEFSNKQIINEGLINRKCKIFLKATLEKYKDNHDPNYILNAELNHNVYRDGEKIIINGEINLPSKIYIFYLNNKNEVATLLFPNKFENKINFSGKFVFPANNNYDLVANFPLNHNKDTILENIIIISIKSNKGNFKVIDKEPFISILSRLNELGRDKWRKLNLNYLILRE